MKSGGTREGVWDARFNRAAIGSFLLIAVLYGGAKPNGSSSPNLVNPVNPVRTIPAQQTFAEKKQANWNVRGAWKDSFWLDFEDGWLFPHGTNHLSGVEVVSFGQVWATPFDTNAVASAGEPFEIVRGLSSFACEFTPSNSYRVAWTDAALGRDTNALVSAALELFRNGDVAVTTNGVTTTRPRVLPFPHNGFGQDAEWVAANFTNAAEILAVGYPNWVDAQVGEGLTNGLYKFTASFVEPPPEATILTVGDYSVCVTNAGDYVFVLEKGTEYEFFTWPFNDDVEYSARDDMAPAAPVLRSWWGGWDVPGTWTADGGWNWLDYPAWGYPGSCCWLPTLQGSPDVVHLGVEDFPAVFEAKIIDYCGHNEPSYHWTASDANIHFSNPTARSTEVASGPLPSWGSFSMSVQADFGFYSLVSYLDPTYGTNDTPQVDFSMRAPEVVFLNDDARTTRWYRVSLTLSCPVETNVTVSITHSGPTGAVFSSDPLGADSFALTNIQLGVSSSGHDAVYEFYCACTNLGSGEFDAVCMIPSGEIQHANERYRAIEPLRKLVCTEAVAGGYYNPSRLVYGTNAWLKVGARGSFDASEVSWRIVSGPGRITATDGWAVSVEPTAASGEVVVEAAFGNDSLVQPRFVLPIVSLRVLPVRAFVVVSNNVAAVSILKRIDYANKIFSQAGVKLDLISVSNEVGTASDFIVSEFDNITNSAGQLRKVLSAQARRLMDTYTAGDCLELYFVNAITNGKAVAFRTSRGMIVSNRASDHAIAHEIGHCLGLKDCYAYRRSEAGRIWIEQRNETIDAGFMSRPHDWGRELKRGFYANADSREHVLYDFLMYGVDGKDGVDIPSGDVLSLRKDATSSSETQRSFIGADYFKPDNNEVFSK